MTDQSSAAPRETSSRGPSMDAAGGMTLFVMIVATLYFGREVLVPVVLALLLTFIIAPLVELLRRLHLGRVPSVLLGVVLALGIVVAIGGVIGTQVAQLSGNIPQYATTIEGKLNAVREFTVGRLSRLADSIGPARPQAGAAPSAEGPAAAPAAAPRQAAAADQSPLNSPFQLAERYLSPVLAPLATFGIVFVITVFALLQREDLRDRMIRLAGSDDLHRTTLALDDAGIRLSRYFVAQLSINSVFGVVIGIGLLIVGVPNPVLWGITSAILRFVPYVGAFISAALPIALAAAVEPGWSMALWTAALYLVVEGVTGQVIEPLLYGHSTGLSPFSVVVAAIFWSWLWGPIGLILSTPLTLCLVVLGRHVKRLEFLDIALGDRPALTAVESFYQRILAGDADEAQDHAEQLLKERSLTSYYDDVALKSLQMAADDAKRGVVDHALLDKIKTTITVVVEGLDGHDDVQPQSDGEDTSGPLDEEAPSHPKPPPAAAAAEDVPERWRGPSAVLCIAGRGPLDEAAAAMLAQLLGKHGLHGRVVGYDEVSRENVEQLDVTGVAMACVSYLDISGSPAHLRYLMRRLRQTLPAGAPILVGLWPSQDSALHDGSVQQQIGADYFTSSLSDAVGACVAAATKDRG